MDSRTQREPTEEGEGNSGWCNLLSLLMHGLKLHPLPLTLSFQNGGQPHMGREQRLLLQSSSWFILRARTRRTRQNHQKEEKEKAAKKYSLIHTFTFKVNTFAGNVTK